MKYNMFSTEVQNEINLIRDYGGIEKVPKCGDSYKSQALRELAGRLYLEDQIKQLNFKLGAAMDILDGIDSREIERFSGYSEAESEKLLRVFKEGCNLLC